MTGDELAAIVREHTQQAIAAALAPVLAEKKALEVRILELETRPAERGPSGAPGDPGPPGVGIAALLLTAEGRMAVSLTDGRTLDAGPVPRGTDGAPGVKGDPGDRGAHGEKGLDGLAGKDGAAGRDGKDGAAGLNGTDGIGVQDAVLDRAGHLVLTLSDGRTKDVGLVTGQDGLTGKDGAPGLNGKDGRDGLNGTDGADGMTLDDAELVADDDGWILRLSAGGRTKDFPLPIPHDVGPWTAGASYAAGAGVSWDGGYWIAKRLTTEQPGSGDGWRLAVRRGKQGKEGPRGKDGRDFTPSNTPPLYS